MLLGFLGAITKVLGPILGPVMGLWGAFWFHFTQTIWRNIPRKKKRVGPHLHKILIIGDSTAQGYGDSPIIYSDSGLAKRLRPHLAKAGTEGKLRSQWLVSNLGWTRALSVDWTPDVKRKPRALGYPPLGIGLQLPKQDNLWREVFENVRYKDAEVVVIMCGLHDRRFSENPKDLASTATNILKTARRLAELGKVAVICTLPIPLPVEDEETEQEGGGMSVRAAAREEAILDTRSRNELLVKALQAYQAQQQKAPSPAPGKVMLGQDLSKFRWQHEEYFHSDGFHFGSRGYKSLAKELFEEIFVDLVAIEFAGWKVAGLQQQMGDVEGEKKSR